MSENTEKLRKLTADMRERVAGLVDNTARIDQPGKQLNLLGDLVAAVSTLVDEIDRIDGARAEVTATSMTSVDWSVGDVVRLKSDRDGQPPMNVSAIKPPLKDHVAVSWRDATGNAKAGLYHKDELVAVA